MQHPDDERYPRRMSTIEKAVSRLTSRRPSGGSRQSAQGAQYLAAGRASRERGTARGSNGAELSAFAPARFCEIDLERIRERGFLLPGTGRNKLAREMRRIKRPLLLNLQKAQAQAAEGAECDKAPNLIMITSAIPGEGKTFTAINLAMSMAAEVDRRVLLVDADVGRGDVSRQLGLEPQRGLSDLLREPAYLMEDAVLTSNVERLSILPGGSPTDHIDELFASEMMDTLLRSLAEADPQRVVIFDAPPLLATTEAAVLAGRVGQTVMVVEAGRTPQDAVAEALAHLESHENVSLVLNKTFGKEMSGYGYGYDYGAGDSGGQDPKHAQAG